MAYEANQFERAGVRAIAVVYDGANGGHAFAPFEFDDNGETDAIFAFETSWTFAGEYEQHSGGSSWNGPEFADGIDTQILELDAYQWFAPCDAFEIVLDEGYAGRVIWQRDNIDRPTFEDRIFEYMCAGHDPEHLEQRRRDALTPAERRDEDIERAQRRYERELAAAAS